jgi:hypothetical protein
VNNQNEYYRGVETAARALAAHPPGAAAAAAVHAAVDVMTAATRAAPRACAAGCAHCCHFPVGITLAEAHRLATALAGNAAAIARVVAAAHDTAAMPWSALVGRPCPLLVAGVCVAYAARPVPCRSLASADATACAAALADATAAVPRDEVAYWRGLGAAATLAAAGPGSRELRSALAAVLTHPDDATAAFAAARPVP